jgi:hypothetical protein
LNEEKEHLMRPWKGVVFALVFAGILPCASAFAAASPPLPENTIDCKDWKHLPGGEWQARENAKPFDVGTVKGLQMQGEIIGRRAIGIGSYDLAVLLDRKCGTM